MKLTISSCVNQSDPTVVSQVGLCVTEMYDFLKLFYHVSWRYITFYNQNMLCLQFFSLVCVDTKFMTC